MTTEKDRAGRLRRLLGPLAVLYEKAVLEARKEPFEVRLKVQQSPDHLRENHHGAETVHIIHGESLQAAHEVWQEYRRIEKKLPEQNRAATSDKKDGDDTVDIPAPNSTVVVEKQENLNEGEQLPDGLNSLSAPERAWLEWFYSLSEEDQKIVEICGENDISVTPVNFDLMKKVVKERNANAKSLVDTRPSRRLRMIS